MYCHAAGYSYNNFIPKTDSIPYKYISYFHFLLISSFSSTDFLSQVLQNVTRAFDILIKYYKIANTFNPEIKIVYSLGNSVDINNKICRIVEILLENIYF